MAILTDQLLWQEIESRFARLYSQTGQPALSICLMEGLLLLQHIYNLSDEVLVEQCGGRPCIRGLRIGVVDVIDLLAAGLSQDQILQELPDLASYDIKAALLYTRGKLDHPAVTA